MTPELMPLGACVVAVLLLAWILTKIYARSDDELADPLPPHAVKLTFNQAEILRARRDQFAQHAPRTPAPWFTPVIANKPKPIWQCSGTEFHTAACGDAQQPGYRCWPTNMRERDAWDRQLAHATQTQWPWAWADAVLAAADVGAQPRATTTNHAQEEPSNAA